MSRIVRALATIVLAFTGLITVTSCASPAVVKIEVTDTTYIIDVRSADKYAAGHVQGAYNIDFSSPNVENTLQGLGRSHTYILYGDSEESLNKAYQAMTDAGFIDVKHSGSMDYVSQATGLPVVTG